MASKRPLERLLLIDRKISSALAMIVAATFFIGRRSQVLTQAWQRRRNFLALATLGIVKTSCRLMRIQRGAATAGGAGVSVALATGAPATTSAKTVAERFGSAFDGLAGNPTRPARMNK